MDRRRALKTLFCYSSMLALKPVRTDAAFELSPDAMHLLAIGDFGTTGADQKKVAAAMSAFVQKTAIKPESMLLIGDNFYSPDKEGFNVESKRWKTTFEDVYPVNIFPGPCWAILGNHDYHDNRGGEQIQLQYAREKKTRWSMPSKWYRFEIGGSSPRLTVIALDSNLPAVSGGLKDKKRLPSLSNEEEKQQLAWLETELSKPRAPMTLVLGHHPLYSNGSHGDTKSLIESWGPLFKKHKVHAYLCGHDHDMQHLELEGLHTSFILSGGGGAKIRKLPNDREMPYGQAIYGFTHLEVLPNALRFTHFDADGQRLHCFTKHQDGKVEI
jgi:hypothetical protein